MTDPNQKTVRVRIAPSPTGTIHLGLARTSLFNWAFARHHGGVFILRIEDTDHERSLAESEQAIFDGLRWLGLEWDEGPEVGGEFGPYNQAQRIEGHIKVAGELLAKGACYRCFCTRERLDEVRSAQEARKDTPRYDKHCREIDAVTSQSRADAGEPFTVRFKIPAGKSVIDDLVRGEVTFDNSEVDDWVMVRQGGNPTYNFVVVCDDADMQITHVFRGEEHLVNTPKQTLLYAALGLQPPRFAHLPLMTGKDGKKLSKRHGSVSLDKYRQLGYSRDAMVNFLARQGWALDGETEIFSSERMVEAFDISDVGKAGSVFDFEKLAWMSGEYVHRESLEELGEHCAPYMIEKGLLSADEIKSDPAKYASALSLGQERIRIYSEMPDTIGFLFGADDAVIYDDKAEANSRKHDQRIETLKAFVTDFEPELRAGKSGDELRALGKAWVAQHGLKFQQLFQPLRCALTGKAGGPDLFDIMLWLGVDSTLARIATGLERLA